MNFAKCPGSNTIRQRYRGFIKTETSQRVDQHLKGLRSTSLLDRILLRLVQGNFYCDFGPAFVCEAWESSRHHRSWQERPWWLVYISVQSNNGVGSAHTRPIPGKGRCLRGWYSSTEVADIITSARFRMKRRRIKVYQLQPIFCLFVPKRDYEVVDKLLWINQGSVLDAWFINFKSFQELYICNTFLKRMPICMSASRIIHPHNTFDTMVWKLGGIWVTLIYCYALKGNSTTDSYLGYEVKYLWSWHLA